MSSENLTPYVQFQSRNQVLILILRVPRWDIEIIRSKLTILTQKFLFESGKSGHF